MWKDAILRYLPKANTYCSFAFKHHWIKQKFSRKKDSPLFRCYGTCTFSSCPIKFIVAIRNGTTRGTLSVIVKFTNNTVCHGSDERRSRQIQGRSRKKFQKILEHKSPSTLYRQLVNTIPEEELYSGKRDRAGSSVKVLQKISSEGNIAKQNHFDLLTSLVKLHEELNRGLQSKKIGRYIQSIQALPLNVTCFTEEGLRLYHQLGASNTLYLDATGTIVSLKKTKYDKCTMLYYALVMGHPNAKQPPIAIAEFLTADNSVLAVSHFLETFKHYEYRLYGSQNVIIPKKIVIDRSMVLFLSLLKVFFNESISKYYDRCYRVATGAFLDCDLKNGYVCACIAHVMKSMKNDLQKIWYVECYVTIINYELLFI